eukprot:TRINITY_DN2180_c0_g3_i5.p1 TRINITY_DN2180_c0_g3~~TRINITY_DN2180_c0_g3_i5.p1  ORF type:complete len:179 (+),score=13.93 TRINITY_DN2180_c0_g3_i5:284-820(+)
MSTEVEMDECTYELTRSLSLFLLKIAREGDNVLNGLEKEEKEDKVKHDPWRVFSPYTGSDLCLDHVWIFVIKLVCGLKVAEQCSVLALVFLDRFMENKMNAVVCTHNIFPLFTSAYILACKVHDDTRHVLLSEVNRHLPFLDVELLKQTERLFLKSVDYHLYVRLEQFLDYVNLIDII